MHPSRPALTEPRATTTTKVIGLVALVAYGVVLITWMVFKDVPTITLGSVRLDFSGTDGNHPPNLVPFRTILPYLLGRSGALIAAINLVGNVAILVPIGLLLPFTWTRATWRGAQTVAVASGLSIETMQTILHVGVFDIDDVVLNALGVMIGFAVSRKVEGWVRTRSYRLLALSGCLVVAAASAFYALVIHPISHAPLTADAGVDPCNGTGGNGEVVALGAQSLTLQPRAAARQVIDLTDTTVFKDSRGPATRSDLRVGDRVTLVINTGKTASFVLICGVVSLR